MVDTNFNNANKINNGLLLCITIAAFFLVGTNAVASDPLDPGQTGESMSMPLPQELIQAAMKSGVITDANALNQPDSSKPSFSVNPPASNPATSAPTVGAANSANPVNVTGSWFINLNGTMPEQMQLNLIQNKEAVMGRGTIIRGGEQQNISASGTVSGDELSLVVVPVASTDMYKLSLSLSTLAQGSYTVYLADGSTRSGDVTFTVTSDIFKPISAAAQNVAAPPQPAAISQPAVTSQPSPAYQPANTGTSGMTPVQLSGSAGSDRRISSSKSISMAGGAGSMSQSTSSSSF